MIKGKTALELTGLARAGASLEVNGGQYTALELTGIAHALHNDATLKIHNSDTKTTLELTGIAGSASGRVIFA